MEDKDYFIMWCVVGVFFLFGFILGVSLERSTDNDFYPTQETELFCLVITEDNYLFMVNESRIPEFSKIHNIRRITC